MAISATTQWNVRTTGSDSNGGGFDTSSSGTDYSQQDAAQIAYTDLVIGATNTQLTSAGHPFTSAHVGNVINITGGTGFTVGRYQVVSVAGSTATMDQAVGTASSTGGTGNLGGALLTIGAASGATATLGNTVWIKTGTYTITSAISVVNSITFQGYGTTHGDSGTAPLITTSTNSINNFAVNLTQVALFANLSLSSTATTRGVGIAMTGGFYPTVVVNNCKFDGFKFGITGDNNTFNAGTLYVSRVEVKNCVVGGAGLSAFFNFVVLDSYIHDNAADGILSTGATDHPVFISRCIVANNGGRGINLSSSALNHCYLTSNTVSGNAGDGVALVATGTYFALENNLFYANGGYGFNGPTSMRAPFLNRNNAYGPGSSGSRNNFTAGSGDITLTAAPFSGTGTAPATADFAPHTMTGNSTPGPAVASSSSNFSTMPPYKAFDGVIGASGTNWLGQNSGIDWLQLDTSNPGGYLLSSYKITVNTQPEPARAPKNWTMQGSNDGSTWTTLDTQTNQISWGSGEARTFTIGSPGTTYYRYFRVNITANNGDATYTQICELNLYGLSNILLYSNFALNATAGGGLACTAAGSVGAFPGGTTTGYLDIGAVQSSNTSGSTGGGNYGYTG